MKVFEAIEALKDESIVIRDTKGNLFQRTSKTQIMQIWNRELLEKDDNCVASSIGNNEFLEKYLHEEFQIEKQWYQDAYDFPILCKVKEIGWSDYKIVSFNSRSGYWFNTGFSESYTPSYNTEITPLSDDEIKAYMRGY
ncbi:MAG: hypothetical protein WA916_08825 [Arcobacter sp.]|uniref:hypothetical protein n=1 Tax=Arcobacter sp. TaxID=1872629 RepID=UPI003C77CDFB